jgi:hypothetical protein
MATAMTPASAGTQQQQLAASYSEEISRTPKDNHKQFMKMRGNSYKWTKMSKNSFKMRKWLFNI